VRTICKEMPAVLKAVFAAAVVTIAFTGWLAWSEPAPRQGSTYVPGTNLAYKPAGSDAVQFVSNSGSDTNDGLSWGTAKLTESAACASLPGGNSSCTAGSGTIVFAPSFSGTVSNPTSFAAGIQTIQLGVPGGQSQSTAFGTGALYTNCGVDNTAFGFLTIPSPNCTGGGANGEFNAGFGHRVLLDITTGNENSGFGNDSLEQCTTCAQAVAMGYDALNSTTTGNGSTAVGWDALSNLTTGQYDVGIGIQAGQNVSGGGGNQTSTFSTYIGTLTFAKTNGDTNEIVIGGDYNSGSGTVGAGSNTAVIGSPNTTDVYFGGSGPAANIHALTATVKPVTFSTLPACSSSTEGATAAVTDSTTNTWGATISGSGSDHVLAYCDGTNWTVAGK
jgi:hypothetical protein